MKFHKILLIILVFKVVFIQAQTSSFRGICKDSAISLALVIFTKFKFTEFS